MRSGTKEQLFLVPAESLFNTIDEYEGSRTKGEDAGVVALLHDDEGDGRRVALLHVLARRPDLGDSQARQQVKLRFTQGT